MLDDAGEFHKARFSREIPARTCGWLTATDTEKIGSSSVVLGAGRIQKRMALILQPGSCCTKNRGQGGKGRGNRHLYTEHEGKNWTLPRRCSARRSPW